MLLSGRKWNEGDQELISGDMSWSLIKVRLDIIPCLDGFYAL